MQRFNGSRPDLAKSLAHMISGNLFATIVMSAMVLLLPKVLDFEQYGYWQLYILYVTYMAYISFGIKEGFLIRFSGVDLGEHGSSRIPAHVLSVFLITLLVAPISLFFISVYTRGVYTDILIAAVFSTILFTWRTTITIIYQAADKMWLYARCFVIERVITAIGTFGLIFCGVTNISQLIWMEVLGRFVGFSIALVVARKVLFKRVAFSQNDFTDIVNSMKVGIPTIIAALSAVLVTVVGRLAIERGFSITVFAEVALSFSLVGVFQTFASAISVGLLPSIKKLGENNYVLLYEKMMALILPLLGVCTVFIIPIQVFALIWLPSNPSIGSYISILTPLVVFESISRIVSIPLLQATRQQGVLALINFGCLLLAVLSTYLSAFVFADPRLVGVSISLSVFCRSFLLDFAIRRKLGLQFEFSFTPEFLLCFAFTALPFCELSIPSQMLAVFFVWIAYLIVRYTELKKLFVSFL